MASRRGAGTPAALAVGAAAALAGAGGVLSLVRRRRRRTTAVRGTDLAAAEIRLARTPEALAPGRYSFWFDGGRGHARLGEVLRRERGAVVRRVLGVDSGELDRAREGRFNGWMHLDPAPLGVPWASVRVRTTLGSVPAWLLRAGTGESWAVLVHGRSSVRQEALRAVPAFLAAGRTVLLPAYRGDGEAPAGPAPRYPVQDGEWIDVESAVLHALDAGATDVVLAAWSSGAAIALATAAHSQVRSAVSGLVLDSPVLGGAPPPEVPTLVLHGEQDGVAPIAASRALAAAHRDLVRLLPFEGARHTRLWNADPVRWEAAVTAWLAGDAAALDALSRAGTPSGRRGARSRRAAGRSASRSRRARAR